MEGKATAQLPLHFKAKSEHSSPWQGIVVQLYPEQKAAFLQMLFKIYSDVPEDLGKTEAQEEVDLRRLHHQSLDPPPYKGHD